MSDLSQRDQILRDLRRGRTITPMDALRRYGCMRPAARIEELRRDGYPIETKYETNGSGKRWARYRLRRAA